MPKFDLTAPWELLQRVVALERQHGSDEHTMLFLLRHLDEQLSALPANEIFNFIHNSNDLEEDEAYWACIRQIRRRGDQTTFDTCVAWAKDSLTDRRQAAADILGQLRYTADSLTAVNPYAEQSLPVLEALLDDPEFEVKASALTAMGSLNIGDPARLVSFIQHPDPIIRHQATWALTGRDDPISIAGLIALSRDADSDVRNWATFGLAQQTDMDMPELREALFERIHDDDPERGAEIRGEAFIGLAKRQDQRILAALQDELAKEFVGDWCIEAAELLKDKRLVPALIDLKSRLEPRDLETFGDKFDTAISSCCPT